MMRGLRSSRIGGQARYLHDGASEVLAPTVEQPGGGRLDEDDHPAPACQRFAGGKERPPITLLSDMG